MSIEVQIMLVKRADISKAALLESLREERHRLGVALCAEVELVSSITADAVSTLPHIAESPALSEIPDAILTIRDTPDRMAAAVKDLADRLESVANTGRSSAVAGYRHVILPGGGPVRLFFGLRRLEHLSRAEFQHYWLYVHADFGRRLLPPFSYHQVHVESEQTKAAARAAGVAASPLDGIVEVHFPDVAASIAQLSRPDVSSEALADERNFIDHSRSLFWIYETL